MPLLHIPNAGSIGLIKDLSQHELPVNAWTDAQNIRFLDGYAYGAYGYGPVYGTPTVQPYHVIPVYVSPDRYWVYAGTAKMYRVTNTAGAAVHINITRQSAGVDVNYTGTANSWTSTLIGGIPILNNGVDVPQYWDLDLTHRAADLTNWPVGVTCKAMRSFRSYLVALNLTEGGVAHPFLVRTSHPADPGTVPASWDYTDTTKDSLRFDLAVGYDPIVDGCALRDSLVVYKESSIWRIDFTGGQFVHKATKVLGSVGALTLNCIVELDGFHAVLTGSDVIVHDGQAPRSILDKETRRWLFQNIDTTNVGASFVFKNPFFNEIYFVVPQIGSTIPDRAVVWNFKDDTCSLREVPSLRHASFGPVDNGLVGTWSSDSAPWDSDLSTWDGPDLVPSTARVLMAADGSNLYLLDGSSALPAGTVVSSYLERRGLSIDQPEKIKIIKSIRPRIVGNTGYTVKVYAGASPDPYTDPEWTPVSTHTIGSTHVNDFLIAGRYLAVRFESDTAYQWRLDSYDIEYELEGQY